MLVMGRLEFEPALI